MDKKVKIISFLVLVALLASLSGQATANTPIGSISGHMRTTNGDAVAGGTVQLYDSGGSTVATATTDSTGFYQLSPPVGTYTIQAYKVGVVGNYMGSVVAPLGKFVTRDITVVPIPSKIKLSQSKSTIMADGHDYTVLTAHITDAWDKTITNCPVVFTIKSGTGGFISSSTSKQALSSITISPDSGNNYNAYYGWVPASTFTGQATITVSGTQSGTGAKFTSYYYVDVSSAPTPTPFAVTPIATADNTPPVTAVSFDGQLGGSSGAYSSDVVVTLSAADNGGSGVARTEYSLGSSSWTPYTGPFTINNDGRTTIFYRSVDNSGNIEATKSAMVNIVRPTPTPFAVSANTVTATPTAITVTATPVPATPTPMTATADTKQSRVPCVVFAILPLLAIGIMAFANNRKDGK